VATVVRPYADLIGSGSDFDLDGGSNWQHGYGNRVGRSSPWLAAIPAPLDIRIRSGSSCFDGDSANGLS